MKREELMKHIGSIEQIGGVKDYTINDGKGKGVRVIEVNTGNLSFCVLPDRCMDVAQAFYKNNAVAWISKTGITDSRFYDPTGLNWLRGFYGGLITTCGLRNIGGPYEDKGLHGRIANTPASKVSIYADWEGDDYVMKVSGEMRESVVFGENLVLKRTITTKLFSEEFTVEDTVVNEGFQTEGIALCYHCNFGYPLVREGSRMINVPEEIAEICAPVHGIEEECIVVEHTGDVATTGIENGEMGAYITYKRDTMPEFLVWKMMGESEYVVGLEPRTSASGGETLVKENKLIPLKPLEEYKSHLVFHFKTL